MVSPAPVDPSTAASPTDLPSTVASPTDLPSTAASPTDFLSTVASSAVVFSTDIPVDAPPAAPSPTDPSSTVASPADSSRGDALITDASLADTPPSETKTAFLPVGGLLLSALRKFDPRQLWSNPVLLLTWVGALLVTLVAAVEPLITSVPTSGGGRLPPGFSWTIAIALWLVLYIATFAESLAEGRGRAQTLALRRASHQPIARRLRAYDHAHDPGASRCDIRVTPVGALRVGNHILVEAGESIPADGQVVWGVGLVDESAITGESAPVVHDPDPHRCDVIGGTQLLSDRLVVRVTQAPGHTAMDRMIALTEGAHRQKAPKELALSSLLASFSISFVVVALTLNVIAAPHADAVSIPILVSIVVCLIPTEIAALMSVTGIASMYQLLRRSVLVDSGHALETAGDVTTILIDKTGTITAGDRRAIAFWPLDGVSDDDLILAAIDACDQDESSEGQSIREVATSMGYSCDEPTASAAIIPFSAQTRLSGVDLPDGTKIRKGAESAIIGWLKHLGAAPSGEVVSRLRFLTDRAAHQAATPLVVAIKRPGAPGRVLGVIPLKDRLKWSARAKADQLRALGVKTIMITGDNPITARTIAADAGVDDFVGDATPQDKLAAIIAEQAQGHFVAMGGDGANDAPALAQADIGVAMGSADPTAKQAANMVVLDDDPTRIIDIIEIGRRQQATRGALITFNMANDIVRYFALFPALFAPVFPGLDALNLLRLHSPASAVLSTVIFSIAVMGVLIPLALAGVPYRLTNLSQALSRNLVSYGLGGIVIAAVGIKGIDLLVQLIPGY
jgi:K+-transporting ATPase ATPase B chain